ncbi:tRNA (uracil(54)-C(5))-methyltransferase homolog-B [Chiloscyllium plagiosum]|uniref:tRNA (uracil(54)-C(5))-methyltransferase homolog-B n=1 Tax=Chiloscyllium plagiosum TaxID=36176 RepID=UPI001CB87AC6|nr:tRNA (uracil(54)-C(5))-methyltransferase homolog-B [Chiloscyllium plagiosum]
MKERAQRRCRWRGLYPEGRARETVPYEPSGRSNPRRRRGVHAQLVRYPQQIVGRGGGGDTMSAAFRSRLLRIVPQLISQQDFCFCSYLRCCRNVTFAQSCSLTTATSQVNVQKPFEEKRKSGKTPVLRNTSKTWEERLADAVTPLWRMNYEEQLQVKYEAQKRTLQLLTASLPSCARTEDLCCPLHSTLPSPVTVGYRNKSTFSVNRGPDGNPKTVGHYIGTGKGRNIVCTHSDHLVNMPEKHKQVARSYEQFIQLSPLEPCILFHEGGHWREITVRTNRKGDTMAIVYFHPQHLEKEEIAKHQKSLVEYFTIGPGAACELTCLYFQESSMTRCLHEHSPYQLLYGIPYIYEEVLGLTFRISPDAFFQVNSEGAEVLYQTVRDLIRVDGDYIVLDVCCGTGAIGLTLSQGAAKVIGIELIEQAVEDARCNAILNGIANCEFLKGKAEIVLPQLLPSLEDVKFLIAVVNPSRAGLHYRVVRAIRNCEQIRQLVYISCKPEGEAMRNFVELCCPPDHQKKLFGDPFTPRVAVPVDMFPHTSHCELVLLFER